jgi:hypothetical protein
MPPSSVKRPTIRQSVFSQRTVLPTSNPTYCLTAPSPTMISVVPGLNMLPSTSVNSWRNSTAFGPTPRNGMFAVESLPRSGTLTTPKTSGEIIGSFFSLRLMFGALVTAVTWLASK